MMDDYAQKRSFCECFHVQKKRRSSAPSQHCAKAGQSCVYVHLSDNQHGQWEVLRGADYQVHCLALVLTQIIGEKKRRAERRL